MEQSSKDELCCSAWFEDMSASNTQLGMGRSDVVWGLVGADQFACPDKSLKMIAIADITAVSPS